MFQSIPTPFDDDGELDEPLYADMIRYYVEHGVNALFVFGPFGQGPAMSVEQRARGLEIALEVAGDRVPVVPDVGAVEPYTARALARHAREHGATAVAASAPYFYSDRSPAELVLHFAMIDEVAQLPMLIVTDPAYQGYTITLETMAAIREGVPRVFGVHPAHTGVEQVLRYQNVMGMDFRVFPSPESLFPGMLLGQAGTMSPPLSMAVDVGVAFVAAIDRGDTDEALRIHLAILRYLQRLGPLRPWYRAGYREGLRHIGFPVKRSPRWPTAPVPDHVLQEFRDAIDEVRAAVVAP